jgi:hypothetical protein
MVADATGYYEPLIQHFLNVTVYGDLISIITSIVIATLKGVNWLNSHWSIVVAALTTP